MCRNISIETISEGTGLNVNKVIVRWSFIIVTHCPCSLAAFCEQMGAMKEISVSSSPRPMIYLCIHYTFNCWGIWIFISKEIHLLVSFLPDCRFQDCASESLVRFLFNFCNQKRALNKYGDSFSLDSRPWDFVHSCLICITEGFSFWTFYHYQVG